MSKISEARQALRDYAREQAAVVYIEPDPTSFTGQPGSAPMARGEAGGKAFTAAQAALTVAEELRAEADIVDPDAMTWDADTMTPRLKREAANRIEAAILKALS